ncbi:MAG: type IV pilus biogenesis protein EbsA [Microcystaceae cyanobacterium]
MSTIEQLESASKADVLVYQPYYPKDKHSALPYAITLYQKGYLEGQRHIEGGDNIPFVATWYVSKLPSELTRCRLQFDGQAELSYEITILNAEFIDYLVDVIQTFKQSGSADFPQGFYRKLLRFEE